MCIGSIHLKSYMLGYLYATLDRRVLIVNLRYGALSSGEPRKARAVDSVP